MATLEELTVEATSEIEAAKPLYKQVNNERMEYFFRLDKLLKIYLVRIQHRNNNLEKIMNQ